MKISRIFRKYSRVLLLVFMSILLVVFLIGDVISSGTKPTERQDFEVGQAFGKPVTTASLDSADSDFQTAGMLGFRTPPIIGDERSNHTLAMHLLIEEARRAGVVVPPQRVVEALQRNPEEANARLERLRGGGRGLNSIYESTARVLAVWDYYGDQAMAANGMSQPELEQMYRDQNQEARVLLSVIDANAFLDKVPTPTDEEIQAYFDECKDRDASITEEQRVDGYRIGNRVRVEYLTIDPKVIEDQVRISAREVQRYYEDNKQKYVKEVEGPQFNLEQNAPPQKVQMTFEEAETQVRQDCRTDKAVTEAQRLMNLIQQEARRPWDAVPLDENKQRQAPAADAQVSFEQLRDQNSGEYPVMYQKTELLTEGQLGAVAGLGSAAKTFSGKQSLTAAALAFRVKGLVEASADDQLPILQLNEPSPVMITPAAPQRGARMVTPNQAYMIRVVEVKPAGPPDSLDEVRDRVVMDLKRQRAFKMAEEQAKALADRAKEVGLKDAVAGAEELRALLTPVPPTPVEGQEPPNAELEAKKAESYLKALEPTEPPLFKRQTQMRGFNNPRDPQLLHDKVFASPADGGPDPAQAHPIVLAPSAGGMRWILAELEEIKPIYQGDFDAQREKMEQSAMQMQMYSFMSGWFDVKNIEARASFVSKMEPAAPAKADEPGKAAE